MTREWNLFKLTHIICYRHLLTTNSFIPCTLVLLLLVAGTLAHADDREYQWSCDSSPEGDWRCYKSERPVAVLKARRPAWLLFGLKTAINPEQPRVAAANNLDWVDKQDMTPQQRAAIALEPYCCGAYIEPARDYPDAQRNPEQAPLRVNALSTEAPSDSVALLEGDVHISQGYRQVRSDSAKVDQSNRQVSLAGNVRFREPDMLLMGDSARLNLDSKEVAVDNATYVLHQASVRGTAKTLLRLTDGTILIEDASYTGCQPDDDSWRLKTSEIELDQQSGFATVKNARLHIKDVPVFYFPYAKFPINDRRSSGLLFPAISINKENGLDYTQPIYWNIATNYDATFSPRYIEERGTAMEAIFRHLSSWSTSEISTGYLGNDKGGKDESDKDPISGLYPHQGEDRYWASIQHQGATDGSWTTFLDFNHVSDVDYFRDLGQMLPDENSRTHLNRQAFVSYSTANWDISLLTQDFQSITLGLTDQYTLLPKVSIDGHYRLLGSIEVNLKHEHAVFDHDIPDFTTGSRSRLDYQIGWDQQWNWGFFKPNIGFKYVSYDLDYSNTDSLPTTGRTPSVSASTISIDSGIFLHRDHPLFTNLRQTFEPRLYYLKTESKEQSFLPDFDTREIRPSYDLLFRDSRFYGGDRISDDHRISIGLTTSFVDKRNGRERLRARLAQAIYLDNRQVTISAQPDAAELARLSRDQSHLAFDLSGHISKNWRLSSEIIYDNHDNHVEKGGLSLRYNDNQNNLFNFAYRYTQRPPRLVEDLTLEQDIEQVDVSFFVPLGGNFNWVGRWNHDITHNRELEAFAGVEYNNCCWRASLVARRWLERSDELLFPERDLAPKNGVFLQIQLKGLAGTGGRVDKILQKGIQGYEPLENF
jgi:LPS-assembly protein